MHDLRLENLNFEFLVVVGCFKLKKELYVSKNLQFDEMFMNPTKHVDCTTTKK